MQWPRKSYAQMGEDLIIENNINKYGLGGSTLTYLEIGTNHPCNSNNTFLFYEQGARGVLVEPDENYWDVICEHRPEDTLIKACVADYDSDGADFYIMTARSLNTLSKEVAEGYCTNKRMGKQKIEKTIKVPVINVNLVLTNNFPKWPNIISVDTEGMDISILKAIDWNRFRAEIVCVESQTENKEIAALMRNNGYKVLGDNCLNTIFGKT